MAYEFKIGTSSGGMTLLSGLSTPVPFPAWTFQPWAEAVQLGDGKIGGFGLPKATWKWGFLTQAQRDMLRTFCTGKSALVYIRTLENETHEITPSTTPKTYTSYRDYLAVMIWPEKEDVFATRRLDFTIEFQQMEIV